MTQKSELGQFGENIACEYLKNKGYRIIGRNIRQKWGELDIVAQAPDKTLVFVEVKTLGLSSGQAMRPDEYLQPEDQLTKAKLRKLQKTAALYAGHYPERVSDKKGWRIDLVAITLRHDSGQALGEGEPDIRHYENIGQ